VAVNLYPLKQLPVNAGVLGDNTLIPAAPGGVIRVFRWFLWVPAITTLIFRDGANALTGTIHLPANIGMVLDPTPLGWPWFQTSPSNPFVMNNSAGAAVAGWIDYDYGN
jgi:hypothetical protein